jgi:autotransporter-associated beta strand protein
VDGDVFTVDSLFLGGYAGSGALQVEGGSLYPTTLRVGGTNAMGGSGTGTVAMSAGEIVGTGVEEIWFGSRGGEGILSMSGTASLTNNQQIHFGRDGGTGTGTIGGNAYFSATQVGIGIASPGKTSEVTVEDEAFFNVTGGNLVAGWLGDATGKGILNIHDSATVTVNGEFRVGFAGASGRLAADGGTLNVSGPNGYLVSGRTGGTGEIEISGNAVVQVNRFMMAGADGTGNGSITVGGGASVSAERFTVAYEQDTSGVITVNGGTLVATATGGTGVVLGGGGNGMTRQLNLNGGMITASGFAKKDGDLALDINFNGGTVRASENNADYFRSGNFDGSSAGIVAGDLELAAGGLTFDTAGFTVGITQALSSTGGLKKSGAGTLTIAAAGTYTGGTSVTGGTLELANPSLNDNSTVSISGASSILDLSYAASDTIAELVIDGVEKVPGLYRSAEGSGPGTVLPQLSGTGVLNVSGQSLTYATWLAANAPATGFATDSDRDGIPNGVEHVLGTSPNQSTPGLAVTAGSGGSAVLSHSLNPQLAADVSYHYEWSSDLAQWRKSGQTNASGMSATITASLPDQGQVTVTATPGGVVAGKLFVRLAAGLN